MISFDQTTEIGKWIVGTFAALGGVKGLHYIAVKIREILKELRPDGGASLRDQMNRIEETNQWANIKFRVMMDRTGSLDFTIDHNLMLMNASMRFLEMLGVPFEDAVGTGWINRICQTEREAVMRELSNCAKFFRTFDYWFCFCKPGSEMKMPCHVMARVVKVKAPGKEGAGCGPDKLLGFVCLAVMDAPKQDVKLVPVAAQSEAAHAV